MEVGARNLFHFYVSYVHQRFHRSMSRPFFTRDKISHFDIFDRHAEDTISQVKARLKEGEAVDIQVSSC